MKNTPADEILADFLATKKGFLVFFWIYGISFFYGSHWRLNERFARVQELSLEPMELRRSTHAVVCVSGFLTSRSDISHPWEIDHHHPWTYGQLYCMRWETDMLLSLGEAFQELLMKMATQAAKGVQMALSMTNPVSLMDRLLSSVCEEFNDVFDVVTTRANQAGKHLANVLLTTALSEEAAKNATVTADDEEVDDEDAVPASRDVVRKPRPVSLVGFSFGATVIVACLKELRRISSTVDPRAALAEDLVCDVVICGAAVGCSTEEWTDLRRLANGRFVNCYLRGDKDLVRRQFRSGINILAGTTSLNAVPGIENVSMDKFCSHHAHYAQQMPLILNHIFQDHL